MRSEIHQAEGQQREYFGKRHNRRKGLGGGGGSLAWLRYRVIPGDAVESLKATSYKT